MRTTALVAKKDQILVQVKVLATVVILLVKARGVLIVFLVLELIPAQEDTIVILPHHTPHALALAQLVAAVAHTLVAGIIIILVKLALELVTL
jgi:hypothetical protein